MSGKLDQNSFKLRLRLRRVDRVEVVGVHRGIYNGSMSHVPR